MVIVCIISFDWFLYFTGCIKKELCLPCIQDEHNSYPRYHLIYCLLSDSPFPCFTHNCGAPTTVRFISQNNHLAFSGHLCKCLLHGFSLQLLECYSRLFILPDSHHRRPPLGAAHQVFPSFLPLILFKPTKILGPLANFLFFR